MILCLETATDICSVSLCNEDSIRGLKESTRERSHASSLTVLTEDILREAGIKVADLEAIAVSKGPGSYTGLRIGVSTAKGLAYASSVPLIGIDTTLSMYYGFITCFKEKHKIRKDDLFCPAIDARRMEIYYSVIDTAGNTVLDTRAEVIGPDSFTDLPPSSRIFLFGNGADKCRNVIRRENIIIEDDFRISASYMQKPAYIALKNKQLEDVAYFEPFYLKDFLTTLPVKNILK